MGSAHEQEFRATALKISYYRKLKNISQEQLAEAINKSRAHIAAIEAPNVDVNLSLNVLFDIADALGVPAYRLIKFDE